MEFVKETLSTTLFSLYINDLVSEIKNLNIEIKLKDEILSILLYAYDMVLMADNDQDLQSLLDCVGGWCTKWKLSMNIDKTKVVHFRPKRWLMTEVNFYYQDKILEKSKPIQIFRNCLTSTILLWITVQMF